MKILQIINNLGSGGAEKLIVDFVPLMRDKGHEVEVLLLQKKGSIYIDELKQNGIEVTWLSLDKRYSLSHILKIRNFINKGGFDIINVHLFPSLYFVGILSILKLINSNIIYTRHYTKSSRTNNVIFKKIDQIIYKGYDNIIAITGRVEKSIIEERKADSDRIKVVGNGVDINKFSKSRAIELSTLYNTYHNNHKVITMIGRFSVTKDQGTLIKAIEKLPDFVNLVLVGEGELIESNKELVRELDIEDRVHFVGMRKDVSEILKASDVGVLSSKMEGMPVSALEIFASGTPFIGSDVLGINELFSDYDSENILFEYQDSEALSILINDLIENNITQKNNINICNKIVKKFSLEKMVEEYLEVYRILKTNKLLRVN